MATKATIKPSFSHRAGLIQGTTWDTEKGRSISISKSYKNGNKWVTKKITLFPWELAMLREVLGKTENFTTNNA